MVFFGVRVTVLLETVFCLGERTVDDLLVTVLFPLFERTAPFLIFLLSIRLLRSTAVLPATRLFEERLERTASFVLAAPLLRMALSLRTELLLRTFLSFRLLATVLLLRPTSEDRLALSRKATRLSFL